MFGACQLGLFRRRKNKNGSRKVSVSRFSSQIEKLWPMM